MHPARAFDKLLLAITRCDTHARFDDVDDEARKKEKLATPLKHKIDDVHRGHKNHVKKAGFRGATTLASCV